MDLKEKAVLGDAVSAHWYYVSKGRAMLELLNGFRAPEILDVGAGSGVFSRYLVDRQVCQSAVCVDPGYAEEKEESYKSASIRYVRKIEKITQRLVLMIDVLEHVEDDLQLLKKYTRELVPGARVLVLVPAFQFLWSAHDDFLGHLRRYRLSTLETLLTEAGLTVLRGRYFFGLLFPLVAVLRVYRYRRFRFGLPSLAVRCVDIRSR